MVKLILKDGSEKIAEAVYRVEFHSFAGFGVRGTSAKLNKAYAGGYIQDC